MKKHVFTFVLGAAAGGSTIAFISRDDTGNPKFKQTFPVAAEKFRTNSNINKDAESNQGSSALGGVRSKESSRFIERSSRKTGWESFDLTPTQEWNWNWD